MSFDATTGSELNRWESTATGAYNVKGTKLISGDGTVLEARSLGSSDTLWRVETDAIEDAISQIVVDSDGHITVLGDSDRVISYDGTTGEQRWIHDFERAPYTPRSIKQIEDRISLSYGTTGYTGRLRALDRTTGEVDWEYDSPSGLGVPTLYDGVLYVAFPGSYPAVLALEPETGTRIENWDPNSLLGSSRTLVRDGDLFFVLVNDGTALETIDIPSGAVRWTYDGIENADRLLLSEDHLLYRTGDHNLVTLQRP